MFKPASPEKKLEWQERIRQQRKSGTSIQRWCLQNKIAPHVFHYWKKQFSPKEPLSRSCFTELPSTQTTAGISIEYRGVRIHIDTRFDPITLQNCLFALRRFAC